MAGSDPSQRMNRSVEEGCEHLVVDRFLLPQVFGGEQPVWVVVGQPAEQVDEPQEGAELGLPVQPAGEVADPPQPRPRPQPLAGVPEPAGGFVEVGPEVLGVVAEVGVVTPGGRRSCKSLRTRQARRRASSFSRVRLMWQVVQVDRDDLLGPLSR